MKIVIPHIPISQCRHRSSNGRIYDPLSEIKKKLKWFIVSEIHKTGIQMPHKRALALEIHLYTPIAKSCSKAKKTALEGTFDLSAPDVDNYAKFYMDTMNRIAYEDDRFISRLVVEKIKSVTPRVEIVFYPLDAI